MVVDKVNEDVNLPLVSEVREERMIQRIVETISPMVEPSLKMLMPDIYVTCIKLALNEELSRKEREEQISDIMRGELSDPLTHQLNERVDLRFVPEGLEGVMLKIVSNKIIDEFVERTVGKVSEELEEA